METIVAIGKRKSLRVFLNPLFVWLSDFATCKGKGVWKCVLAWGSQQTVIVMLIRLSLFSHYSGSFKTFSSFISKPFPFTVDCTRKTVFLSFFLWLMIIPFSSYSFFFVMFFIYFHSFLLFHFCTFFHDFKTIPDLLTFCYSKTQIISKDFETVVDIFRVTIIYRPITYTVRYRKKKKLCSTVDVTISI